MANLEDFDYVYPERLIATQRVLNSRVMRVQPGASTPVEMTLDQLVENIPVGDLLVVNDTKVLRRRVFCEGGLEILFLSPVDEERRSWRVLCPSSRWKQDRVMKAPEGVALRLVERGRTQIVEADVALSEDYFERCGELPLPPYIQKARGQRSNRTEDRRDYQTAWAQSPGSLAAPTASLHFSDAHLQRLRDRGVLVETITLHVGLGTFLPVTAPKLEDHIMHAETAFVSHEAWNRIMRVRDRGNRVWALGTTVTRTLESVAHGYLRSGGEGFEGATDLFIRPGAHEWRVVGGLLTNFHQPRSTLIALVASFAGLEAVKSAYAWAIDRDFRLFSYGDLTVWTR